MIQMLTPDGITVEVVELGTDFDDDQRVSAPMAAVLHGGTHTTVIEGTREEIVTLLLEAVVAVKEWEPPTDHDWKMAEGESTLRCRRCRVRVDVDSIQYASWDCIPNDDDIVKGRHVWAREDRSTWACIHCETTDPSDPCHIQEKP
jgi:hypothetical protein